MERTRACDRCYAIKEKCVFQGGLSSCTRCSRLDHRCTQERLLLPRGRRPHKQKSKSEKVFGTILNQPAVPDSTESDNEDRVSSHSELAILSKPRTVRELGQPSFSIGDLPIDVGTAEENLLHLLLDKNKDFINRISVGPSFADEVQKKLRDRLLRSPNLLGDAYLATSGGFWRSQNRCEPDELDLSRGASALQKLRNIRITDYEEIPIVLSLGLCLLTFELFCSTSSATLICRHTLSLIKPWYSSVIVDAELDFEALCLIFLDTVDCLIRRQVPVLKYAIQDKLRVDRYTGLCSSLLPILYEVCELGHSLKQAVYEDINPMSSVFSRLEGEVQNWRPTPPSDFLDRFSSHEVVLMLTQAKIMQTGTLLLLHRLRFPFGTEDHVAKLRAQYIFSELDLCKTLTDRSPKATPFTCLVAALEIDDYDHRIRLINTLRSGEKGFYYLVDEKLADFIELVWKERDEGSCRSWFDLLDSIPPFTVRP